MPEGQSNTPAGGAIAAGATPIAALVGSFLGYRSARKNTERSIAANRELAEYQYQRDLEMWNRQNEYNNPANQMARLKAAGLNPNMVYGSGNAAGNVSSQLPKYNAPEVDYRGIPPVLDIPQALSFYQDMRLRQAQTDNVQAQTDNTRARTAIELGIGKSLKEKSLDQKSWDLTMRQQWDPNKAAILQNQAEASNLLTETARRKLENIVQQKSTMQAAQRNVEADTLFKKFRNQWMQMGFTTSDHLGFRIMANVLNSIGIGTWGELGKYGGTIFNPKR